jgi:adenylate cyclase
VKGKQQAVNIYTPISQEDYEEQRDEIAKFYEARGFYAEGNFLQAKGIFASLLELKPDNALYSLYLERCEDLINFPPAQGDGSWTVVTK